MWKVFFFFCPTEILQMKAFLLLKKSLSGETFSVCQDHYCLLNFSAWDVGIWKMGENSGQ